MKSNIKELAISLTDSIGSVVLSKKIKLLTTDELTDLKASITSEIESKIIDARKRVVIVKKNNTTRIKTYTIDEIFHTLNRNKNTQYISDWVDGELIKISVKHAKLFMSTGLVCKKCGTRGFIFALEHSKINKDYHLGLYGYDEVGDEVLLTIDHIFPKSKGGKNILKNYQTLCKDCNVEKGDTIE